MNDLNKKLTEDNDMNSEYFESYDSTIIHEEMINDKRRTESYRRALCPSIVKDKVVMDVGCGTGILSLFAAKNGAKKVYAIEFTDVYYKAKEIMYLNQFNNVVTVIHAKVEDLHLGKNVIRDRDTQEEIVLEPIDVLVSEWMGYNLMYETMISSVIYARDTFLKKDGIILPDTTSLYICGLCDNYLNEQSNKWKDVEGFDFSTVVPYTVIEPMIDYCEEQDVNSKEKKMITFDMKTITMKDLDFTCTFEITLNRDKDLTGFCTSFDCTFMKKAHLSTKIGTYTHWRQTLFHVTKPFLNAKKDDVITGTYHCKPLESNPRHLYIELQCQCADKWCTNQEYVLN